MSTESFADRLRAGKSLRGAVPRSSHARWTPSDGDRDPVEMIEVSNRGRVPQLIPLRFGRMLRDPFAFLRGAPAIMARDLAGTPSTGLTVQACGDCHLVNFGLFATPERQLVFDINDFDETLRATWEWDLKRLAASFVVAGRVNGFTDARCTDVVRQGTRSYRQHLFEFAQMSPLEIWYFHVSADDLIDSAPCDDSRELREQLAAKARRRVAERLLPKITVETGGARHFVENPPITTRITDEARLQSVRHGFDQYRGTLEESRRFMLDRYRWQDFATRVVGVGSVGTRCYVALLACDDETPLLLQIKEARPSVLAPFAEPSPFDNQGQRVVTGQRMMQAASDILLGWLRDDEGRDYYVRQMRDMKFSVPVEDLGACSLERYADVCGWTLARAHAKSGDAAAISGYLGRGDKFDDALAQFAIAYADQTEQDHAALVQARQSGRIEALDE